MDRSHPCQSGHCPKGSAAQNITPGTFHHDPLFYIYPEYSYCSICPFMQQMPYLLLQARSILCSYDAANNQREQASCPWLVGTDKHRGQ